MSLRAGRQYQPQESEQRNYTDNRDDEQNEHTENMNNTGNVDTQEKSTRSHVSRRSSQNSSATSAALKARAKADAARARLAFSAKEASIIKQKADLEASLLILSCEKDAAVAEAEAAAYEEEEPARTQVSQALVGPPANPIQRTAEYVQKHSEHCFEGFTFTVDPHACHKAAREQCEMAMDNESTHSKVHIKEEGKVHHAETLHPPELRPYDTPHSSPEIQGVQGIARYLTRREMLSTGLLKFDDHAENYWAWKASFQNAIRDLNVTAQEELDLIIKWLGIESSQQAKRIRSVHVFNPNAALKLVWERLEESYGSPEVVENALLKKIEQFPKLSNKDNVKLRELGDILQEIECAKDGGHLPGLSYLDTARGVNPIVEKLPYGLQEKWITTGARYKEQYRVAFPPFSVFSSYVRQQAKIRNDPSFIITSPVSANTSYKKEKSFRGNNRQVISVHKTDIPTDSNSAQNSYSKLTESPDKLCPLHKKPHPLKKCKSFRAKPIDERKSFLKDNRICYKCCGSTQHMAKDCKVQVKCMDCGSDRHLTALHPGPSPAPAECAEPDKDDGGETEDSTSVSVVSKCTEICGDADSPNSCSKISPVLVYPTGKREQARKMYAVLDEQSNKSLAKSQFFELFNIKSPSDAYTLRTCSGLSDNVGRTAVNFVIESVDGKVKLPLPNLIECDMIPDNRKEIPSPQVAMQFPHLRQVANKIPPVEEHVPILLLLGRDIIQVHKVRERINGPHSMPYAQRLDLGWVIVGEACLGKTHKPPNVNVMKTHVLQNGRASYLSPCPNTFQVKESPSGYSSQSSTTPVLNLQKDHVNEHADRLGQTVFDKTKDDDKPALSVEDKDFINIMEKEVFQDSGNSWVAPLPFRSPRPRLLSNREQALTRLQSLRKTLDRKPEMKRQYTEFMQNMLDNDHAELAPPLDSEQEHWYLPSFGVYHPQKPDQLRVVFDSSAEFEGQSLNKVLLSGPDLNNTLLGVLMRFRKEPVAFSADVQQMFYCFVVKEEHRDYLRFLWYEGNDLSKDIRDYRMKVHVFGKFTSVAIYCMRRAAAEGEKEHGHDANQFIMRHFYVDDGLASTATSDEAVEILTSAQNMLAQSNLKLHKIASNNHKVVEAFPAAERAKDLKDLDLELDDIPLQRSLGVLWSLGNDSFTFHVSTEQKPYTRRGVLATVNSLYDPLGFVSPITMQGKALLRELTIEQIDWDEPLPAEREEEWSRWRNSLKDLEQLQIPRCYLPFSQNTAVSKELCIFSDASTMAIGAVAYLRALDSEGQWHTGFIMGKSKVAPRPAHTVPRLELCAAVLAVELFELIRDELDIEVDTVKFYTDSKIVLGYIHNNTKRFYTYVANRVTKIRKSTHPAQWHYVATSDNPADVATRPIVASTLPHTNWFSGPSFLTQPSLEVSQTDSFSLINPDSDAEIRHETIKTYITKTSVTQLESSCFERFSHWMRLCRTIASLKRVAASYKKTVDTKQKGWQCFNDRSTTEELSKAARFIIHTVQSEAFREEYKCIKYNLPLPKQSSLKRLNPIIDEEGLLRIGGRLAPANLTKDEKHPLIIPHSHHIAVLLVRYYHEKVAHQGQHITEGALRGAGLWIIGCKRLVSSVIHTCVLCRKLRGQLQIQKMADLPVDRLSPMPPFTSVGLDVFGPWSVTTRRTRGGSADSKRWAVLFTCMSTRAVHIELIESMSTSSFINALRRFFSVRGPAQELRSDKGTNFIGACNELKIDHTDSALDTFLQEKGSTWLFNSPHSSHMGGAWERLIGVARRILDGILLRASHIQLTHEVLSTFMAEVMAIMNARPLVPVSTDPDNPILLTPAMLLTQKTNALTAPTGSFAPPDLHSKQWKQVQCLADSFWKQWRTEYLSTLQQRRKWTDEKTNINVGDIVLLKDSLAHRNDWSMGRVVKTVQSKDNKIRKAEVKTVKDGNVKVFLRPIAEMVLLLPDGN